MSYGNEMAQWQIEPTNQFSVDQAWYTKKHPDELQAVLNNLVRYLSQLKQAKNPLCVTAGYIHTEQHGVIALDQKGGGGYLQETRLYLYADNNNKVLYIITIGNKSTQEADIKLANKFVSDLQSPQ